MSALGHLVKAILVALFRLAQGKEEEPRIVRRSADALPIREPAAEAPEDFDFPGEYLPPHEWVDTAAESVATPAPAHDVAARLRDPQGLRDAFVLKTILDPPRAVRPAGRGDRWARNLRPGR